MTTPFQKVEPVSKKSRVVELLKEAILSGAMQSGEQIVEAKLAQQFGVGQGLIREALIELEHRGYVQRTPYSNTQVARLSLEDAQNIFDVRIELEPLAFGLAGAKVTEKELAALRKLVAKAKSAGDHGDLDQFFDSHLAFRKKIWELSGNKYLESALERLVVPLYTLYLIRRSGNREGLMQSVVECIEHQEKVMNAYAAGNIQEAKRVARDFLVRMKEYLGTRLLPS